MTKHLSSFNINLHSSLFCINKIHDRINWS